jgi:hypothetical protein
MTRVICIDLDATGRIKLFAIGNPDETLVFTNRGHRKAYRCGNTRERNTRHPMNPTRNYYGILVILALWGFLKDLKNDIGETNESGSLEYHTPYDTYPPQGLFEAWRDGGFFNFLY